MSITLSVGATSVALPADLYWSDELAWHPVGQSATRSVTGALIVQVQATTTAGRPITLAPPVELASWLPRSVLLQLRAWADVPGQVMQLQLHGALRDVMWRHQDGEVITTRPVMPQEGVAPEDAYTATLKLMEV
ncbi:MAG TPA: hypothetical protein VGE36_04420 [Roseateles sp.]